MVSFNRRCLSIPAWTRTAGLLSLLLVAVAPVRAAETVRLSVSSAGGQAEANPIPLSGILSYQVAISASGRFVVFASTADNLVPGDTNGVADVFLRDRDADADGIFDESDPGATTTTRVSLRSDATQADGASDSPSVSADGRLVVFASRATNLADPPTSGSVTCIYVYDRQTGITTRISAGPGGVLPNGDCASPVISAQGNAIAFASDANNLVAGDTNTRRDIFVGPFSVASGPGSVIRITGGADGETRNGSDRPDLSANGRFVAFDSVVTDLVPNDTNSASDVFVYDRDLDGDTIFDEAAAGATGTIRVSVTTAGVQGGGGSNPASTRARISADGRFVAFASKAPNFNPLNSPITQAYIRDRRTTGVGAFDQPGTVATILVSTNSAGAQGSGESGTLGLDLSSDGRFIAFGSTATNLVPLDPAPPSPNQIFLRDRTTGFTTLVSVASDGTPANAASSNPVVPDNGAFVAFDSDANNLVPNDTNGQLGPFAVGRDVFSHRPDACEPVAIGDHPIGQTACSGAQVTLSIVARGSPTIVYQWRKNGQVIAGANADTLTFPAVAASDSATYTCVVQNACGGPITSNGAVLSVTASPAISAQPPNRSACAGATVTFNVSTTGSNLSYQWRRNTVNLSNGGNVSGATSSALVLTSVSQNDVGSYDVVISNSCGQVTSNAATLALSQGPVITSQPADRSVCTGGNATFSVTAQGTPTPTYQWRRNGSNIPGATSAFLTRNGVTIGDAGDYTVVVTNSCGSTTSDPATLSVGTAPVVTSQPANRTICGGQSIAFTVGADGVDLTYQWRKGTTALSNAGHVSGVTTPTLSINQAAAADGATNYNCVITGPCGSTSTSNITLRINTPPSIDTPPAGASIAAGGAVTFNVAARGTAPLSYQWRKNGNNIANATNNALIINPVAQGDAGTYDVVVRNSCNSVTSAAATLTVTGSQDPPPDPDPVPGATCGACGAGAPSALLAAMAVMLVSRWRRCASRR